MTVEGGKKLDHTIWRNRLNNRNDMAARITHLTRGNDAEDAFKNLWKILVDKKLNGSGNSGFINGERKAVCLQELPLSAIAENLRYEEILSDKIRYSPFGVRFHKMFIYNKGGRPVIYENKEIMKKLLPENEYWRIVDLDLTDSKSFVDWTHEREWRVPGELSFSYNNIEVIVKDSSYYRKLVEQCIKTKRTDILVNIRGIITLDSVYS
jgi:hypothetical protein